MLEEFEKFLEFSSNKYKEAADKKRRLETFFVGDVVMAHIGMERTPTGSYSKL